MPRTRLAALLFFSAVIAAMAIWWLVARPPALSLEGDDARYRHWQATQAIDVAEYRAFLASKGVGAIVPPEQLFRSGRRWRICGGEEFGLPPKSLWPQMVPTLRLLADLEKRGLLGDASVASAFRTTDYNRCEGGSSGSRHLGNQALDLDLLPPPDGIARLCQAWRQDGARLHWGLGFYSATQIHLDTAGFRTWGSDHHAATSLCRATR